MIKLSTLIAKIEHEIISDSNDCEVSAIACDTSKIQPGGLFICLKGLTLDGHDFAAAAAEAGAAVVVVEKEIPAISGVVIVKVENTRKAMSLIAARFYGNPAEKLRLIGVTGTNGKSTTTYFIDSILRHAGQKTALIGTIGAQIAGKPMGIDFATATTPDPIELHKIFAEAVKLGVTDVVMEVSSHSLALHKMEGLTFEVGVFTNLTQDHLDFHGTMENYRAAKAMLFEISKTAVFNADDAASSVMREGLRDAAHDGGYRPFLMYGIENSADLQALHIKIAAIADAREGYAFTLATPNGEYPAGLPLLGRFNIYNSLAAIGAARLLGLDMDEIIRAVSCLPSVPGRIQSVAPGRKFEVIVDYAHSPDGLENILKSVREFTKGRVICLFGCGGDRDRTKRPQMGEISGRLADYTIITSDNPRTENPDTIATEIAQGLSLDTPHDIIINRRDAIFAGIKMLQPGDSLIIAGKGHEDYQIIGKTKHHFDDVEIAREALAQK